MAITVPPSGPGRRYAGGVREMRASTAGVLLLGTLLLGVLLAGEVVEPALLVGVLGALVCAWGTARHAALVLPQRGAAPAVAAREHRRTLARRAVPRQRDPDAAGHIRSRAPSGLLPAV